MNQRQNRLVDHVMLRVKNLERSKEFYQAIAETLGHTVSYETHEGFSMDGLFITQDNQPSQSVHLAFQAANPGVVKLFHQTALQCGGRCLVAPDNSPAEQDQYAAMVSDPDGNNVEVVYRVTRLYSESSI